MNPGSSNENDDSPGLVSKSNGAGTLRVPLQRAQRFDIIEVNVGMDLIPQKWPMIIAAFWQNI